MSSHITPEAQEKNERILSRVEELGGGYVWDAEVFAVTLVEIPVADADARGLVDLVGVQQLALDCSRTSISVLREIAAIPGLQSLVLCNSALSHEDLASLRAVGPGVEMASE